MQKHTQESWTLAWSLKIFSAPCSLEHLWVPPSLIPAWYKAWDHLRSIFYLQG